MPLPKKIKKNIPLTQEKTLLSRRYELLEKINKDGTYLPKSLLHADLDRGFLDFVKDTLKTTVEGKVIPTIDIIITTQNWSQFTETWNFQNLDKNAEPPFITVVRIPEVKFGTNPAVLYNIPNRKLFFYAQVPTWDGNRQGTDVYKIPQPVPVDITYTVKIICNRMRELNQFNKNVLETFASRQAYQVIKGHYIPIVMNNITDESVLELEKRKYYIQSYEFTMLGFLMDEDEFEISPAVNRVLQVLEVDTQTKRKRQRIDVESSTYKEQILFIEGNDTINQIFDFTSNIILGETSNIDSFDVYINNQFYGTDLNEIQINTNDVLKIVVVKEDNNKDGSIELLNNIV
jgi:hypothetical protein